MRVRLAVIVLGITSLSGISTLAQNVGATSQTSSSAFSSSRTASAPVLIASANSALPANPDPVIATGYIATPKISERRPEGNESRDKKIWYTLTFLNHGAATFDAWSTRASIERGNQELNPVFKPFASSNMMYAAVQVVPLGMDYLGKRMMRSQNRVFRKMWWVPQTASAICSFSAGVHNMGVGSR
jgi:hypothetical protein